MSVTPKQERFCKEVVRGRSLSEAYRLAYDAKGMSVKSIHENASKLASNTKVTTRLAELAESTERQFIVENVELIREAARIVFADIRDLFHKDGSPKPAHLLPEDISRAVQSVRVTEKTQGDEVIRTFDYKLWDKNSAMERLYKFKGLFESDNNQRQTSNLQGLYDLVKGSKPIIRK